MSLRISKLTIGSFCINYLKHPLPAPLWTYKMTEHAYRKFPEHAALIQALREKDRTFREICDDYEEMCTWLAAQSSSIDPHAEERLHAREIIRDLEAEIIKELTENQ